MDTLDPYNVGNSPVSPTDPNVAVPGYNMMQYIADHARAGVVDPRLPPLSPAQIAAATSGGVGADPTQQTTPKQSAWDALLAANPDKATDPKAYADLANKFRLHLESTLYAHKYTKDGVEAVLRQFDDKVTRGAPQMPPGQAADAGADHGNLLGENLTGVLGAAAKVLPGAMSAMDLAYRNIRGLGNVTVSGHDQFGLPILHTPLGDKTGLGRGADAGYADIDKFIRGTTSKETLAQEDEIAKHIQERVPQGEIPNFVDTIAQYLDPAHWRATTHMATQGAATLLPMGATGKAIELLGGAEKLKALTDAERILALGGPTGLAYAGQSSSEFEDKVRKTPIDQLLKDRPDLAHIYQIGGSNKEAADSIKQSIIDGGADKVFGINAIGNAVLPAIPGLHGAEGVVAGLGAGRTVSMARNAVNKAVSEGVEEGIAGGTQDTAQNQALGRPILEGAGANVAQNALAGALGGAAAGVLERKAKPLKRPAANASTNPATGAQEATTDPATPVAERGGDRFGNLPAQPMTASGFATVAEKFAAALHDASGAFETQLTDKKTGQVHDAEGITRVAENQAAKNAGKATWEKLDVHQRLALVEAYLREASKSVEIPKLDEFIDAYKTKKLADLAPAPANAPAAPAGVQETPLPAGVTGEQVPGTVAPEVGATEHAPAPQNDTERKMVAEEARKRLEARTLDDLTNDLTTPTGQLAQSIGALLINDHKLSQAEIGKLTLGQAREIINNGIRPAPTVTPAPQTVGKLKRVPIAEEAKTADVPKTTDSQKARNIFLQNFLKSLADKPNPNDAANRTDPRFNLARAALSNGHITNVDQLSAFLDAEGKRLANEAPVTASLPVVERKPDNRLVSRVRKSVGKDNAAARKEVKALMQVISEAGTMTPTEMDASTVDQLRAAHAEVVKNGGTPPVEAPKKTKPKSKGKKTIGVRMQDGKEIPSSQVTTTPNDSNNMPVGKNKERKVNPSGKSATGSSYGSALVSSLITETFGKLTGGRKAQNHANQILNRLNTLREEGVKGIPTETALGKYTYDELVEADDRIVTAHLGEALKEEKSRNLKVKSEKDKADLLAKQEAVAPTDMERAQTSIESLATEDAGKLADKKLSKSKVQELHDLFKANLKTGKFSDLQAALTKAGVFKPQIDKIIAQAKEARKAELSRFEGFKDAEGKPLTKSAKDKLAALYSDYTDGTLSLTKFRKGVQAITFDETGNGPEKVLEATAAREKAGSTPVVESTPPKTIAPLTKGADAGKKSRKKPATTTPPSIPVHAQIAERFADLGARARKELVSAVKLAQEGDGSALAEFIKDHLESEEITKEDAVALRKMGAENPIDHTIRTLTEAKEIVAEADDSAHEEDVLEPTTVEDVARNLVAQQEVQADRGWMEATQQEEKETKKGAEAVKAWLQSLRKNTAHRAGADFALWLLDQNPKIAEGLSVRLQSGMSIFGESGVYSYVSGLIKLDKAGAKLRVMVHEIMHHSERLMPEAMQAKIREEYSARFENKVLQQQRIVDDANATSAEKLQAQFNLAFLKLIRLSRQQSSTVSAEDSLDAEKLAKHLGQSDRINKEANEARSAAMGLITGGQVQAEEMYKYTNASEYWAEEASSILARRAEDGSWKAQLKEWYTEFVEHVKAALGKDNQSELYKALRSVLNSSGEQKSPTTIRLAKGDSFSIDKPTTPASEAEDQPAAATPEVVALKEIAHNENISNLQRFWEAAAKSTQGILEGEYQLFRDGIKDLHFTDLVSTAISVYRGRTSYTNQTDVHEVVRPFREYLEENFRNFTSDDKFDTALKNINTYFGNKHLLERIRFNWAYNVALKGGRSVDRDEIIQEWKDGELGSKAAKLQLISLAQKYGVQDMQDHAEAQGMSRATFEAIDRTLDALKNELGMSDTAMEEINTLRKNVADRQRQRMIESGLVSKKDKWIDLYGYEYYVPLKGNGKTTDPALNDFTSPNETRVALAKLNQSITIADNRVTFAEDPLNRLFVDTMRSGERAAFKGVAKSLYLLAVAHKKEMGAHITRWDGTPKDGYTNGTLDNNGKLKLFQNIQGTANSIIYHNGDQHYVVRLPAESQFLRGLAGMNAVKPLPAFLKPVSKATNTLGRLYTTFSPFWSFAKGFIRDWTTIPASIATENFDNPLQASSFVAAYSVEMLKLYKAFPTLSATIMGDVGALKEQAKEDSEGYAAFLDRYLAAGGANNFTEGFEIKSADKLFKGSYDTADGMWENSKLTYDKVAELTGNWANFLEQMTRVAAFKALLHADPNMSDEEAAVKVRRVLDYSESGTYGRIINGVTAFYRTSMTSTDTMVRSFRGKDGRFDSKKFGIWTATYAGIGLATFLASAGMMGDDDDKDKDGNPTKIPKINKIKLTTLVQQFAIPVGDKVYGIPIGLGMPQVMLAPGIVLGAVASNHSTMEEAVGALWQVFNNNGPNRVAGMRGTYTDPSNVLATVIQSLPVLNMTLTQPLLAVNDNLDTFGQPIHREHYDSSKPKYGQAAPNTPRQYVDMAQSLYKSVGVDMFPEDLRYYATNYGGQNVSDLLKAVVDLDNKNLFGEDAHFNIATSRFEIKDLDYYNSNDMYDTINAIGEKNRKYKEVSSDAVVAGKSRDEATSMEEAARAKDPLTSAAVAQANRVTQMIKDRAKKLTAMRADRTLSDARRQAVRKQLDSDLRKETLKAKYLLEKIP